MCVNCESVSNEIDESDMQHEKHDEQRIWTWGGIVIDLSGEHNEIDSIRCISIWNQFRMKPMTTIHNMQDIINTELESDGKCW
jgi:hypothetical protein